MRCPKDSDKKIFGEGPCCSKRNDRRVVDLKHDLEKTINFGEKLLHTRTLFLFEDN